MTTPIDSTSPFAINSSGNKNSKEIPIDTDALSIRTMQDDLLELQKKSEPIKRIPDLDVPRKNTPTSLPISSPEPRKAVFEPKDISSNIVKPFIEKNDAPKILNKKEVIEVPFPEKKTAPANGRLIALFIVMALIIVAIISGGYYFLFMRPLKQVPVAVEPVQPTENQQPEEITPPEPIEKYSSEKPNYLSLDIATLSSEDIKKVISDLAEELRAMPGNQALYEFVVVDVNNNPVTFPIFATATKLNLSAVILKNLGETFSIFLYNDTANERLSLVVDSKNKKILVPELLKQEKTFITDVSFLFLNEKPEIIKGAFQDSSYLNNPIRFFNVNSQITMSIDYAITDNELIIATSKNTTRTIIDHVAAHKGAN